MKPTRLATSAALAAVLLACASNSPQDSAPTVGDMTDDNGLTKNGRLIVKTTSILNVTKSKAIPPDVQIAIDNYDKLLEHSPDPATRAEAMRRAAYLRLQLADGGEVDAAEIRKAIAIYERLLKEVPDDPSNDLAYYQLARAYQLTGDDPKAAETLRTLGRKYPGSVRVADARFRSAELLYQQGRYADAEPEYRAVVDMGPGNAYFKPAQYKYGWSLYKQSKHDQALPVFLAVLERELPPGEFADPLSAVKGLGNSKSEFADDALRVTSLSFASLGGGKAVNEYFASAGEPRFSTLIYASLGSELLEKQRYTDAAGAYTAFVERHPQHKLAPTFQARAIQAFQQGGFVDLVVPAKERYVTNYGPGSTYWGNGQAPAEIVTAVRTDLDDLGRYYHARAQQTQDPAVRKSSYVAASAWYKRTLDLFPQDPKAAEINLLYADALFEGGQTLDAAREYTQTAYGYKGNPKAPEAAFAAIQSYQRLAKEAPPPARAATLRQSADAGLKLADAFPDHPQWVTAVARAAADLFEVQEYDRATAAARRLLQSGKPIPAELRRDALGVIADSSFAQKKYPEAEVAYTDLLKLVGPADPQRAIAFERLAASIYKQGEAARTAGDLRLAASSFQRVGRVAPDASIRATADYDAGSAFLALQDWPSAEASLESFRTRYPTHALVPEADKALAAAYQKDNKPARAADAYLRVAQRMTESSDTRREAVWLAAQLYDKSGTSAQSQRAYEYYLANFPRPLDRAMLAQRKLADIARNTHHDDARYLALLQDLVKADGAAGAARSDESKLMAAQASLEIGRIDAAKARQVPLTLPVNKSLPKRKAATEAAIATLSRAASYGFAEITTAATYELGLLYRDFGRSLVSSERPAKLRGEELEQYNLLLEEQAYPFEEKAIQAHETNLQRMRQGLWNDWIRRSAWALSELAPAKYGKHEQRESSYDSAL